MAPKNNETITTPFFRLCFPNLAKPKDVPAVGGKKAYQRFDMVMAFPKSTDLKDLKKIANAAIVAMWPDPTKRPGNIRSPFKDGDRPNGNGNIMDGFPGCIVVNAMSTRRPGMVGPDPKIPLDAEKDLYPGCWCRAVIHAFAYSGQGGSGVSFGIDHIQKYKDDEPLGVSCGKPEDHFGQLEDPNAGEFQTGPTGPSPAAPVAPPANTSGDLFS